MTTRDLMTEYLAAARRGDWDRAYAYFADDILTSIPGRSTHAGVRRGKGAATDYIDAMRERFRDRIEVELIDMLVSDERCTLILRERFHGDDGAPCEITRANVYRVRDDRIVEIAIFEADQYVVDEVLHDDASKWSVGSTS